MVVDIDGGRHFISINDVVLAMEIEVPQRGQGIFLQPKR
jgi:hypothetical protein